MLLEVELHPPKYDTSTPLQHSHLTSLSLSLFSISILAGLRLGASLQLYLDPQHQNTYL
jgi:hypothetical protein